MQQFINQLLDKYDRQVTRALEILPGTVSWTLILFPVIGSFWIPHYVAYFIILFDLYWLYKSGSLGLTALIAHFKLKASQKYDWMGDVKKNEDWKRVHHLIVVPTYKEPVHTIERGLESIKNQDFPTKKISVVLAFEEREKEAREKSRYFEEKFGKTFANFLTTFHPDIKGEVKGKSSNQAWAGKIAKKILVDEQGTDIDWVTVTSKDADAVLHPKYLAYLTFEFLKKERRYLKFWQPTVLFYNNIWRVPAPIRVVNSFNSVWGIGLLLRQDRLINFSIYSLSLKLLDQVGYWDVDVIPEDYRLFFKSFFKLNGKIEVDPMFIPVYVDAAESTTWFKSMLNQYEQMKRWAWGAADDAYIIKSWLRAPFGSSLNKLIRIIHVLSDHFLWPVYWFVLTLGANIPVLLNPVFAQTVAGRNLPRLSFAILSLCWIALLIIIFVDFSNRPKREGNFPLIKKLFTPIEFILMPIVGLFFSALPGIDAHTRLMLGKYIEYKVTEKV